MASFEALESVIWRTLAQHRTGSAELVDDLSHEVLLWMEQADPALVQRYRRWVLEQADPETRGPVRRPARVPRG